MAAAPAKAIPPNRRAKNGQKAQGGRLSREPTASLAPPQAPLDFALNIMRDESKPDSLRATMARAAMPYLHKRGETQERVEDEAADGEPISDFELARRIAHILGLGEAEGIRELESARANAKIAEEKARAAEARARDLEQRTLAAEAMIAGGQQNRHCRTLAHETMIEDTKQNGHGAHASGLLRPGDAEVRAQLAIAQEKAHAAEARARIAEAHARDMEQRALAVEELIATRRETRGRF